MNGCISGITPGVHEEGYQTHFHLDLTPRNRYPSQAIQTFLAKRRFLKLPVHLAF